MNSFHVSFKVRGGRAFKNFVGSHLLFAVANSLMFIVFYMVAFFRRKLLAYKQACFYPRHFMGVNKEAFLRGDHQPFLWKK